MRNREVPLMFPHPLSANQDGILALGGDLSIPRLLLAYRHGIFPWFGENDPIIWWFPRPRFVLYPDELHIPKSMRSYINRGVFTVSFNQDFRKVIDHCQKVKRKGQNGTWLNDTLKQRFIELHDIGHAHSVEVWDNNDNLVGGLYGMAMGRIFSGESMFSLVSNASKFGVIKLIQFLGDLGFEVIDCQQKTKHFELLGGQEISAESYYRIVRENLLFPDIWYEPKT